MGTKEGVTLRLSFGVHLCFNQMEALRKDRCRNTYLCSLRCVKHEKSDGSWADLELISH